MLLHGCLEFPYWPSCDGERDGAVFEQGDGSEHIYPDLPEMGMTPGREWSTNQDQVIDVVLELIDKVVKGRLFVVASY